MVVFLALKLILFLLEVPVDQLLALDAFGNGGLVLVDTLNEQVNHLDVVIVGDGLLLPFRSDAAAARLVVLRHGGIALEILAMSGTCGAEQRFRVFGGLFIVNFNIIVFDGDDTLAQKIIGLHNHFSADLLNTVDLGDGFGKTDHTLQLTHGNSVRVLANASLSIISSDFLVLLHEDFLGSLGKFGAEGPGETDIPLKLFSAELGLDSLVTKLVNADDMLCQVTVDLLVALIENDEEKIETRHNRRGHVDVGTKSCLAVVTTSNGVGSSENTCSSVESGLDTSLGDGDSLLFHSFVNSNLIGDVHLVKLINGTNAVVCQHQSTSLNSELSCLLVLDNRCRETGGR